MAQVQGQGHDTLADENGTTLQAAVDHEQRRPPELDISPGQRMLSAVSGSVLTSLLVTPLDVVRVRLQSQISTPATISALQNVSTSPSPLKPSVLFTSIPNLGVTACCREVFWANNSAPVCFATSASGSVAGIQNPSHTTNISAASCAVDETRRKAFNSTLDGLQKIARYEGLPTLWRGLSPTLMMAIPANVIYFSGYDTLRYSNKSPVKQYIPNNYAPLLAGSIARVAAAMVVSPIEMFRTRMQATSGSSEGIIRSTLMGIRDMVNANGYTTLWRGLTLTMWRDVPFSGMYWWGYEAGRNRLRDLRETMRDRTAATTSTASRSRSRSRSNEKHSEVLVDSLVAGGLSGAFASIVTTPFDVGKTRQQVFIHGSDVSNAKKEAFGTAKSIAREVLPEDRSMPRFLMQIFREEGFPGLFKGWAARTMKVAPACAIMISTYELGKRFAKSSNGRTQDEEST